MVDNDSILTNDNFQELPERSKRKDIQNFEKSVSKNFNEHLISNGEVKSTISTSNKNYYDNKLDSNFSKENSLAILNSSNIYSSQQIRDNRYTKFSRYGFFDISNEHMYSREYLFFTKPDLHLLNTKTGNLYAPLKNTSFFPNALEQYPDCIYSLQQTYNFNSNSSNLRTLQRTNFIPLLSNHVTSTLDLPIISATDVPNNTNLYSITTSYREGSEISDNSLEFSLEFKDTKFLDVYMFFKIYDQYFRETYKQEIIPTNISYEENKIDCNSFSIYKFIVDDTNTILYYAKVTGAYPITVPRDGMSNFDGTIKHNISFKAAFCDDSDPKILNEFNHVSISSKGWTGKKSNILKSLSSYSTEDMYGDNRKVTLPNCEWASFPFVYSVENSGSGSVKRPGATNRDGTLYKLIWLR